MGEWKSLKIDSGRGWKKIYREAGTGWKALEWVSVYEDFTTFTEVDVAADRIQKTENHVDHMAWSDETTYLYKDYGAGHFGDFTHKEKMKVVDMQENVVNSAWMLGNALGDWKTLLDANETTIGTAVQNSEGTLHVLLSETYNGSTYSDDCVDFNVGDWIYPKIVKSGTGLTCYLYSDENYSTLVDTLNLTLHANHTLRYLYACDSYNAGYDYYMNVDIENFDLG